MVIPLVPMRRSRTLKSLPKPGSKFKRMKQRLQLKVRAPDEPTDPVLQDDIEDAPPPQQDDAPPLQPDDQNEEVGQGNKNNVLLAFFSLCANMEFWEKVTLKKFQVLIRHAQTKMETALWFLYLDFWEKTTDRIPVFSCSFSGHAPSLNLVTLLETLFCHVFA